MARRVVLELTEPEAEAFAALVAGAGSLAGRQVGAEATTVAALDLCLTRLAEDFELPDPDVARRVVAARDDLRRTWSRGGVGF